MNSSRVFPFVIMTALVGALGIVGCAEDESLMGRESDHSADDHNTNSNGNEYHSSPDDGAYLHPGGGDADQSGDWYSEEESGRELPPVNNDQYEDVGTNPFTETGHDPFSTFAADVDTASYDIFLRDVGLYGTLPNPQSVRLEEYVNYFDYDYDAPESGAAEPFAIHLTAAPDPMGRELALLRVGIQAEEAPTFVKPRANLVFLIDTSGSMSSVDKLPLVQAMLVEALSILDPDDTVSIVTYAGSTGVALEPTPASEAATIAAAIESFSSGGSTAGAAGIDLAYEQAESAFIVGGFNHVILCTDGDFNVGISSTDALVELVEEKRETGITFTALGFGRGNLNDAMMERISNAGNGMYSVIIDEDHAIGYVHERLLRTVHHIAKDVKIQVEFNPDHVIAYRLLGYENRAIADDDFRDDTVDAGEVGAGHRVTALYELVLTGSTIPESEGSPEVERGDPVEGDREIDPSDFVLVQVRYKQIHATVDDPAFELSSSLAPDELLDSADDAGADYLWAAALAAFAELLKQSPFADLGQLDRIESLFEAQRSRDRDRAEFVELFLIARGLLTSR